jgi:hypothetical protein
MPRHFPQSISMRAEQHPIRRGLIRCPRPRPGRARGRLQFVRCCLQCWIQQGARVPTSVSLGPRYICRLGPDVPFRRIYSGQRCRARASTMPVRCVQARGREDTQPTFKRSSNAQGRSHHGFPVPVSLGSRRLGSQRGVPGASATHAHFHLSGTASSDAREAVGMDGWVVLSSTSNLVPRTVRRPSLEGTSDSDHACGTCAGDIVTAQSVSCPAVIFSG